MSIFDFFRKTQPAPVVCYKQQLDAEMLATLQAEIARAQSFLDRVENLSDISIGDVVKASFNLRLAQVTLKSIKARSNPNA